MKEYIGSDPEFQNILDRFADGIPCVIDCGYGWANLIRECDASLFAEDPNYEVVQIKEKFGGLRFYFNPTDMEQYSRLNSIVMAIEEKSLETCEECGEEGYRRRKGDYGRMYTSCDEHADED
jgi:hypothetical protein